jgi:uncharacterized membrane protein YbhN (UPF0104 family)
VAGATTPARTRLRIAVQWTVSLGLLAWIWYSADWRQLAAQLANVQWTPWLAGAALVVAAPLLGTARLFAIARCLGNPVTLPQLLDLNLRAMRFVFLPGGELLGGVARWHGMTQWRWGGANAFGILAVERVLDLGFIAAIVATVVPLLHSSDSLLHSVWLLSLVAAGGVVSFFLASAWLAPRVDARLRRASEASRITRAFLGLLGGVATTAASLARSPAWMARALAASAGFWGLALAGGLLIARGAVPDLDLLRYTAVLCLVSLVAQVPVSIAGAGLRETLLRVLMSDHGITPERAILIGTSALVPYAVLSCIGIALVWARRPLR